MSGNTYTTSKAQILRGSQFFLGSATGQTDVFTLIGEVVSISLSASKSDTADVTNMESGSYKEYLPTQIDAGQVKIVYNRVSTDAGQQAYNAAFQSLVPYDFKLVLPLNAKAGQTTTGDTFTFSGIIVGGPEFDLDVTKPAQVTTSVQITGPLTLTEGS